MNKVATKIDLSLDLAAAEALLGARPTARIRAVLGSRIDADDRLHVRAGRARTRGRNLDAALERMEELLRDALRIPQPRTATRPSRASRERRLAAKRRHGEKKRSRSRLEP